MKQNMCYFYRLIMPSEIQLSRVYMSITSTETRLDFLYRLTPNEVQLDRLYMLTTPTETRPASLYRLTPNEIQLHGPAVGNNGRRNYGPISWCFIAIKVFFFFLLKPRVGSNVAYLFLFIYFTAVLSHWDFSLGKFGFPIPGKASCDRVALLNLRCRRGV